MTIRTEHKLQSGLVKMERGLTLLLSPLQEFGDTQELLLSIINGEKDPFVQEQFAKCFQNSLDEEVSEFSLFVEEFLGDFIPHKAVSVADNPIKTSAIGLDLLVEGMEEVVALTKEDAKLKNELKKFSNSNGYQRFAKYGFSHFLKHLKGFRWSYLSAIKKEIGHYKFNKALNS